MGETQLHSTEASLQPWVEDALVKLHARKNSGAKITEIRVSSRSAEAIKLQLRRLQNVTPLCLVISTKSLSLS
ncbi:hypothetical protein EMIHUDRAFT_198698 [Emiliania huxleyi CCMP1516]|uniref:Uncharacterized protein n=2 Tax=Emiliania huxleyi TaxID=2903 RepID=A0A0D3I7Q4_EMIH1|nr:hypothetical protein EMIHUDRAFT_198698 [Emiliania huxleyi CCMP1516]EOD07289.1 hypothetical protein EMIHUDRAFT_198698 [Emiliania huxleyi CCMP1516]|eukprot:XP_005759718.1 hypothetical protein EMIHUDRAFT_198698 [Emiliania huxleyi CCMP1516]